MKAKKLIEMVNNKLVTTKKISQIQKRQSNQNNNGELQRWEIMPNLFTEVAIMAGRVRVWIHW